MATSGDVNIYAVPGGKDYLKQTLASRYKATLGKTPQTGMASPVGVIAPGQVPGQVVKSAFQNNHLALFQANPSTGLELPVGGAGNDPFPDASNQSSLLRSAAEKIAFQTTSLEPIGIWSGELAGIHTFTENRSLTLKHAFSPWGAVQSITDPIISTGVGAVGGAIRTAKNVGSAYNHQFNRIYNRKSQAWQEPGMSGDNIGRAAMGIGAGALTAAAGVAAGPAVVAGGVMHGARTLASGAAQGARAWAGSVARAWAGSGAAPAAAAVGRTATQVASSPAANAIRKYTGPAALQIGKGYLYGSAGRGADTLAGEMGIDTGGWGAEIGGMYGLSKGLGKLLPSRVRNLVSPSVTGPAAAAVTKAKALANPYLDMAPSYLNPRNTVGTLAGYDFLDNFVGGRQRSLTDGVFAMTTPLTSYFNATKKNNEKVRQVSDQLIQRAENYLTSKGMSADDVSGLTGQLSAFRDDVQAGRPIQPIQQQYVSTPEASQQPYASAPEPWQQQQPPAVQQPYTAPTQQAPPQTVQQAPPQTAPVATPRAPAAPTGRYGPLPAENQQTRPVVPAPLLLQDPNVDPVGPRRPGERIGPYLRRRLRSE